jgi:succinate dehydrogenase / fumarate reductase cytochrome b subunit
MSRLLHLFNTLIGSKLAMALSGLALVAFLIGHLLGNLAVYQGPEAINAYGAWLQGHPLLWGIRIGLLVIVLIHIAFAIKLTLANRRARPQRYAAGNRSGVSIAAATMLISGLLVLGFIIFHLLHLTVGAVGPGLSQDALGRLDIHANVVRGFGVPWIAALYIFAMLVIGLHLSHAIQSALQTLGFRVQHAGRGLYWLPPVLAGLITLGFISIPVAVQIGLIGGGT